VEPGLWVSEWTGCGCADGNGHCSQNAEGGCRVGTFHRTVYDRSLD